MNPGLQTTVSVGACNMSWSLSTVWYIVYHDQYFKQYKVCLLMSKLKLGLLIVNLSDYLFIVQSPCSPLS